ncbi:MAG: FtsX-like permease family protein [Candidatus Eisenbacteria bacterium]|nr:FtsX-like permease family protein [Candidatus Eisenbacteria bacterium]
MPMSRQLRLFYLLNRGTRRRLVAANVGLIIGVTLVTLFIASGLALRGLVLGGVLGALPLDQIKVVPKSMDIAFLRLGQPKFLGGGELDRDTIQKLAADEAVRAVYPIAYARFPIQLHADVLGSRYGTDTSLQGVDPRWVADELPEDARFEDTPEDPISILVSRKVLQIYNAGFAPANDLPRLSEGAVRGRTLSIQLGASSLAGRRERAVVRDARIVGLSDRIDPLAVAVPLSVLESYERRLVGEERESYDAAVIAARSAGEIARIEALARDMGLEIAPESHLARQVDAAISMAIVVFSLLGGVVIALSLMNAANTMILILRERRYELGVVRALGLSRRRLIGLLAAEAAGVGGLTALVAVALSAGALSAGAAFLQRSVGQVVSASIEMPLPGWLVLAVLVITPAVNAVAASIPAMRTVSGSIAAALRR